MAYSLGYLDPSPERLREIRRTHAQMVDAVVALKKEFPRESKFWKEEHKYHETRVRACKILLSWVDGDAGPMLRVNEEDDIVDTLAAVAGLASL